MRLQIGRSAKRQSQAHGPRERCGTAGRQAHQDEQQQKRLGPRPKRKVAKGQKQRGKDADAHHASRPPGLPVEDLIAQCGKADIPAGPVWDLKQAAGSEHANARSLFSRVAHPAFGTLNYPPQPARFSALAAPTPAREPLLGEHTREVLRERLALADAELDQLARDGAI